MSYPEVAAVVLAAGKGTRLKSETAKVLHRVAGRSLLGHVLEGLRPLGTGQVVVVVGHQREEVEAEVAAAVASWDRPAEAVQTVVQQHQRGTGHAVAAALPALGGAIRRVLVLPGDTPLLTPEILRALLEADPPGEDESGGAPACALLTTTPDDPAGYGRVLRAADGSVARIVEHADATPRQRAVPEVNGGVYVFDREALADALGEVSADNVQGEQYLTDVVGILTGRGATVVPRGAPPDTVMGVNDRAQLARAGALLRARHLDHLMVEIGVTVVDPAATWIDVGVEVGRDTVVHPGCRLRGHTRIGAGVELGPEADLRDTVVGDGAVVRRAVCEEAWIGPEASVGPWTHLRPGTRLERGAKAGAFVEVKNATVGSTAKVPHLSYVGDADIGAGANFSCGAVTVNYDGFEKHRTVVGEGALVGCDTMLVAPVTIGPGAITAAGSTVTDDVPADSLVIARSRQTVKPGWAARRRRARGER